MFREEQTEVPPFSFVTLGEELRLWNVAFGKTLWTTKAHSGLVRGLSVVDQNDGVSTILSCGDDKKIKLWSINTTNEETEHMETEVQIPLSI